MVIKNDILDEIIQAKEKNQPKGIVSLCTSHPTVLKAAMQYAKKKGTSILVESTCNQVNQYGGYTGLTPADFVDFMQEIAQKNGVSSEQLLLGGDHLGPNVWQGESSESAMAKSCQLVRDYVSAGYRKIHLDASMKLGGDDLSIPLPKEIACARTADLARVAEQAWEDCCQGSEPRYVIGSEVPIPGGSMEHEDRIAITTAESARETIEMTKQAFYQRGLEQAWERVVALVVQPGIEFGDDFIAEYQPEAARELVHFIKGYNLIYEAHSTDYQTRQGLANLVNDHFAILKVGPWLTFAFREAVFALARIENDLQSLIRAFDRSHLLDILDDVMVNSPDYWAKYYSGNEYDLHFARKYSFSDRSRYYWSNSKVKTSLQKLLQNLSKNPIPLSLLSQYMPIQYEHVRNGELINSPEPIILDKITEVLDIYAEACKVKRELPLDN
ncbi:MAG TPA: D-tagatose-bisphosphate aldolase, class II, non-catalytic subunit [Anaerolineaceae bacterium]|nr:D-tagatose-bisphosphate aldolase, class II, non-catalytic subunit [Anaerolineaceae bacterium]